MVQERLKVAVTKVTGDGAVLSWETTVGQQHALTCSLHYGPQTEAMLVKTEVRTSAKNIKLAHLSPHTTYHASLNCSQAAATYKSNTVHFTPRKYFVPRPYFSTFFFLSFSLSPLPPPHSLLRQR
ncbi:hypothetical protein E2C01_063319 [Portunus trituberculatus]|uniref:Fibronectin type-III domain-containing protein n=1 Tax=Portunus trituberculatus TaxID=210409 RepID=A0A5B7HKI1_PORTR|nr:hypothetical protein [Portunus trituberculatus]